MMNRSPDESSALSWVETSPLHLLYRASRVANSRLLEHAEKYGLTPRQLQVLMVLNDVEGLSQAELAARMGMDPSTMAAVQRSLVAKNLVRRRRYTHDTRRYVLRLTERARALVVTIRPLSMAEDRGLLDLLGPDRAGFFIECLERIAASTREPAPVTVPAAIPRRAEPPLPEDRSTPAWLP